MALNTFFSSVFVNTAIIALLLLFFDNFF